MTQRDVILSALRAAGERGVCISDMERIDWTCVLTMRNRVGELRHAGERILSARCLRHKHRGTVFRYFWEEGPPVAIAAFAGDAVSRTRHGSAPERLAVVVNSTPVGQQTLVMS